MKATLSYGSVFGMFLVGCAIYLLAISAKSIPKPIPNTNYNYIKCPNCGTLNMSLNSFCPKCGLRLR